MKIFPFLLCVKFLFIACLLLGKQCIAEGLSTHQEISSYTFYLNHVGIDAECYDRYPPMSSIIRCGMPGDYHYENIEGPSSDSQFLCLSEETQEYYSTWRNHHLGPIADSPNSFVSRAQASNSEVRGFDPKLCSNQIYWILQEEEEKSLSANSQRSSQDSAWSDNMIAITIFSTLMIAAYAERSSWSNTHQSDIITVTHDGNEYHSPSARRQSRDPNSYYAELRNRSPNPKSSLSNAITFPLLNDPFSLSQQKPESVLSNRFPNITYEDQSNSEQDHLSPLTSRESMYLASQDHHEFPTTTLSTYGSPISVMQYYDCRSSPPRSPGLTGHSSNGRFSFVRYDEDPLNNNPNSWSNPHSKEQREVFRGIYHQWVQRTDQHPQSSSEEDSSSVSDQEDEEVIKRDPSMDEHFPVGMSPAADDPRNNEG